MNLEKVNLKEQLNINISPSVWAKLVLLTGANLTLMAGAGLSTAMPAMMIRFADVPGAALLVSMIVTLPALFVVIGGPVMGLLTDRFGRKPVLVGSILLAGLAGSVAFLMTSILAILLTRALVGLSIAGATTATNALIADYFSGQKRAKFMGYQSAVGGLVIILFMPIGGLLADISWEYTFLVYLSVFLVFLPAVLAIREPLVIKNQESLLKESQLKISPIQRYIYAAIFFLQFAFMTVPVFLAYYLNELFEVGGLEVGLVGGLSGLLSFFGGMAYERIGRHLSYRNLVLVNFLVMGAGFLGLSLARTWPLVVAGLSIAGFGLGLNMAHLTTWLAHDVSPEVRGRANGIFVTFMFLGQFMTSLIYSPIINITSYHFGFLMSAVFLVITGLASRLVKKSAN